MFTIEHEFDVSIITLIDEPAADDRRPLHEDITILTFDDRVVVEQSDGETDQVQRITFSLSQLDELRAALSLPEGNYRMERP